MFQRIKNSYYARLMIICICAVCAITMLLLPICTRLIHRQEQSEEVKNYDLALSALSSAASSRLDSLALGLSPLFENEENYQSLLGLYRYHFKKVPPQYNEDVLNLLSPLCSADAYCCGALLLTRTGHLYQYDVNSESLIPLSLKRTQKRLTPYRLQILSDAQIEDLSNDFLKPAGHVYGLSTSVFDPDAESGQYLGALIMLYSTSEFSGILDNSGLDPRSVFSIIDEDQNVLFSSEEKYGKKILPPAEKSPYQSSLFNRKFKYYTAYRLPEDIFSKSYTIVILTIVTIAICLIAMMMYLVAFRISDRKINAIQKGMKLIGKNNLSYRLPVPKGNDEFVQIILSFNSMCDALQRNVEKAYLYEIAQRKAELYAMQTSINPHFLYNALEQIRVQILKGGYSDASRMLLLLSRMYRNQTRRNLYISIAEECSQQENLINFYMYRYGDFEYEFRIPSSIKKYGLPKNTLQPLIENYFVHGYIPDNEENLLSISASPVLRGEQTWISFRVEDNGFSISAEELELLKKKLSQPVMTRKEDNGFALSNVNQRLKLVFGEESALVPSVGSDGTGFCVSFAIPALLPEEIQKG